MRSTDNGSTGLHFLSAKMDLGDLDMLGRKRSGDTNKKLSAQINKITDLRQLNEAIKRRKLMQEMIKASDEFNSRRVFPTIESTENDKDRQLNDRSMDEMTVDDRKPEINRPSASSQELQVIAYKSECQPAADS